jgi:mono/diheme cytochrome c family protein
MPARARHKPPLHGCGVIRGQKENTRKGRWSKPWEPLATASVMVVLLGCYECHGYEGQGGGGPRLAPDPLSLEVFAAIVRKPPERHAGLLSDEKLEHIYEYVESIPPPPDLSSIPLLAEE